MPSGLFKRRRNFGCLNPAPSIDPGTLTWQLKLDARDIVGLNNGDPVATWPDTSGNARNATPLFAAPIYRTNASPLLKPMVDFTGAKNMHGTLPATPIDTSAGLTIFAYISEDTVDATDGGGGNAQAVIGCYTGTDMRLYSVIYPAPTSPQVGGRTSAAGGDLGSGTTAITGFHTIALVCSPPSGVSGGVRVYRDGVDIGGWLNWTCQPNTDYIVSGNGVGNICLKGKIGWVGFTNAQFGPGIISGLNRWFHNVFG